MLKKLFRAAASRLPAPLFAYVAGSFMVSYGAAWIYPPAGFITGGVLLIALVVERGGKP
jgi:hypothetical protein